MLILMRQYWCLDKYKVYKANIEIQKHVVLLYNRYTRGYKRHKQKLIKIANESLPKLGMK